MNDKPICHPDTPESGQQKITISHRGTLYDITRYAQNLIHEAQTSRLASLYDDNPKALSALNNARIYAECIIKKLNLLPPTEDYPENELSLHENRK